MRLLLVALLLGACAMQAPGARDPSAPIWSSTRFEPARFAGDWVVRQAVGAAPRQLAVTSATPDGFGWLADGVPRTARLTGPGRFVLDGKGAGRDVWVLWVDDDFRTAALGTPDGSLGWIIDRGATGGTDRIAAAREIMEFNGYDVSKLVDVRQ